jgi:hypothetical protein
VPNGRNQNGGTTVILTSPIGGVVRAISREEQPEGTAVDALNVLPYSLDGRRRISQRYGISQFCSTSTGDPVQGMLPIGYILRPGAPIGPTPTIPWSTWIVLPWPHNGSVTISTDPGPGSTTFSFSSSQTLNISYDVNWYIDSTLATSPPGISFGIQYNTPIHPAINSHNILVVGAGCYNGYNGGSTYVGGSAGFCSLLADPSTQYPNAGVTGATGSYTFTGQYTYIASTGKLLVNETITGTQTQSSTGITNWPYGSFSAWGSLLLFNNQVYSPNTFSIT